MIRQLFRLVSLIIDFYGRAAYCGETKGQMETLRLLAQHGADFWIPNARGGIFPFCNLIQ